MDAPSPEKGPGSRRQLQVDTTQNHQKTIISQILLDRSFGKLRTVVIGRKYATSTADGTVINNGAITGGSVYDGVHLSHGGTVKTMARPP
jgi:hypothetical protein